MQNNIILINLPNMHKSDDIVRKQEIMINNLEKYCKVHSYFTKIINGFMFVIML